MYSTINQLKIKITIPISKLIIGTIANYIYSTIVSIEMIQNLVQNNKIYLYYITYIVKKCIYFSKYPQFCYKLPYSSDRYHIGIMIDD